VLITSGVVRQVVQRHSREVRLMLRDGRTDVTTEPMIDDVFEVVRAVIRALTSSSPPNSGH